MDRKLANKVLRIAAIALFAAALSTVSNVSTAAAQGKGGGAGRGGGTGSGGMAGGCPGCVQTPGAAKGMTMQDRQMDQLTQRLNLNTTQQTQVREILQDSQKQMTAARADKSLSQQ
ncbi:MAG TPA: hypothetical protein VFS41_12820, partial [Edaphobacter sp.]|nr:hypothetical protein [Edaphobacter sp.]